MNDDVRALVDAADDMGSEPGSWEAITVGRARTGEPGLTVHEVSRTDVLEMRDERGQLVGFLRQWRDRAGGPGPMVVAVAPGHQRQGIGTTLVREALTRWGVAPSVQRFTEGSRALAEAVMREPLVLDGPVARPTP